MDHNCVVKKLADASNLCHDFELRVHLLDNAVGQYNRQCTLISQKLAKKFWCTQEFAKICDPSLSIFAFKKISCDSYISHTCLCHERAKFQTNLLSIPDIKTKK